MRQKQRVIKFLTEVEIRKIIDKIPNNHYEQNRRDKAILEVLFSSGLRISELLALKVSDLTTADLTQTLEIDLVGKNGRQRTIYVSPIALQAVARYFEVRRDDYRIDSDGNGSDQAFCIGIRGVQIMVKKRAKRAGIDRNITPHQLRHSYATNLLNKGVNIYYLKEFLGHSSLMTTQVYLHVVNSDLKALHEKLIK